MSFLANGDTSVAKIMKAYKRDAEISDQCFEEERFLPLQVPFVQLYMAFAKIVNTTSQVTDDKAWASVSVPLQPEDTIDAMILRMNEGDDILKAKWKKKGCACCMEMIDNLMANNLVTKVQSGARTPN